MAFNQVLVAEQGKSANWVYRPLLSKVKSEGSEGGEPDDEYPMKKAVRKHFKVSKPGTGPILNHPLDISDTGLDRDTIEALINELLSTDKLNELFNDMHIDCLGTCTLVNLTLL